MSIQQAAKFFTDASEDPRLGHIYGGHGHTQVLGNVGRFIAFNGNSPKCLPSMRMKLAAY